MNPISTIFKAHVYSVVTTVNKDVNSRVLRLTLLFAYLPLFTPHLKKRTPLAATRGTAKKPASSRIMDALSARTRARFSMKNGAPGRGQDVTSIIAGFCAV